MSTTIPGQDREAIDKIFREWNIRPFRSNTPMGIEGAATDLLKWKDEEHNHGFQELVTRLKDLVNEFDDNYSEGSYRHTLIQSARETLNKVTPK